MQSQVVVSAEYIGSEIERFWRGAEGFRFYLNENDGKIFIEDIARKHYRVEYLSFSDLLNDWANVSAVNPVKQHK